MNMSYCRFENTLADLRDCEEALDNGAEQSEEMSDIEKSSMLNLISMCGRVYDEYKDINPE